LEKLAAIRLKKEKILEKPTAIRLERKIVWKNLLLGWKGKYFGKTCCY